MYTLEHRTVARLALEALNHVNDERQFIHWRRRLPAYQERNWNVLLETVDN